MADSTWASERPNSDTDCPYFSCKPVGLFQVLTQHYSCVCGPIWTYDDTADLVQVAFLGNEQQAYNHYLFVGCLITMHVGFSSFTGICCKQGTHKTWGPHALLST